VIKGTTLLMGAGLGCIRCWGGRVSVYKIYVLSDDGRVCAPCDDDDEAISQARQYVDEAPVEVWRAVTLVARLESK
jgi:hypothetical protein